MRQADMVAETNAIAEQSYSQLDGEWLDWLGVAKTYEHKVPSQDRYDIRHSIILELAKARHRDGKPIPLLRAYRIASLMVALYWRDRLKREVKVCLYSGVATECHCASCSHNQHKPCPYLALRPVQSLDTDIDDAGTQLAETVADDHASDLDAWLDAERFLLGCPMRLVQIANKKVRGIPLNKTDARYYERQRLKELKRYQLTLL